MSSASAPWCDWFSEMPGCLCIAGDSKLDGIKQQI